MFALIDIGNTATKIKVYDKNDLEVSNYVYDTNKISATNKIIIKENVDAVLYSSVVPEANVIIKSTFINSQISEVKELIVKNDSIMSDLKIIGSDLVCLYYAFKDYEDSIIVSFGTATTISVIKSGIYKAKVICPGLVTSAEGLMNKVKGFKLDGSLKFSDIKEIETADTKKSLEIGTIYGQYFMVNGFINQFKNEYNIKDVFLTGGNMEFISEITNNEYESIENAVIKGLMNIYKNYY